MWAGLITCKAVVDSRCSIGYHPVALVYIHMLAPPNDVSVLTSQSVQSISCALMFGLSIETTFN